MNLVKFNSFRPVARRDFDLNPFDNLFNDFFNTDNGFSTVKRVPPANFVELEKEIKIDIAAPGMEKDNFRINIEKGILTIEANLEKSEKSKDEVCTRPEFDYSNFSRNFRLSRMLDADQVSASYKNGMLSISIPKKEEAIEKPAKEIVIS
jgi:HSP20 family protein